VVSTRSARQRELGQNFLIDRNILDVIERLAQPSAEDVVLEVGGGPGVLSVRLAPRVRHLHVVEIDERLREGLVRELAPFANVSLHFADALELDLSVLSPQPTRVIANLPYSVAAHWVVMVQREVGERFAAGPATPAYGVPSVLAQLACDVKVLRPVSRHVFRPVPNVDSVLLGLRRHGPAADREVSALVHAAFAHRRKALAGSLALAPALGTAVRERARAALVELGHPPDERAERLAPEEFRELAARLRA
jgi:16S rRNA (adenine1518-N6/adenine1519-N6)-dimethyltransferase